MAIVSDAEFNDFFSGSDSTLLSDLKEAAEALVSRYCKRTFESTAYTLEKYDGTGTQNLFLKNYPITALTRLVLGTTEAIKVHNTNTHSEVSVSVSSTGITLSRDGSTDATLTFANYPTMATMAAAISAAGNGWSGEVISSLYNSFKSSYLLTRYGANAMDSNRVYLYMPYEDAEDDFEVYEEQGRIFLPGGFPLGRNNVFVSYTAGYDAATMPEDLKLAVKILTQSFYEKTKSDSWSLVKYQTGDIMEQFAATAKDMPAEVELILSRYRRFKV